MLMNESLVTSSDINIKYSLKSLNNSLSSNILLSDCERPLQPQLKLNSTSLDIFEGIPIKWNTKTSNENNKDNQYYNAPILFYTIYWAIIENNNSNKNDNNDEKTDNSDDSNSDNDTSDSETSESDTDSDNDDTKIIKFYSFTVSNLFNLWHESAV